MRSTSRRNCIHPICPERSISQSEFRLEPVADSDREDRVHLEPRNVFFAFLDLLLERYQHMRVCGCVVAESLLACLSLQAHHDLRGSVKGHAKLDREAPMFPLAALRQIPPTRRYRWRRLVQVQGGRSGRRIQAAADEVGASQRESRPAGHCNMGRKWVSQVVQEAGAYVKLAGPGEPIQVPLKSLQASRPLIIDALSRRIHVDLDVV